MHPDGIDDTYLWLEQIDSAPAMAWVSQRNAHTVAALGDRFHALRADLREMLDSANRIPTPTWAGQYLYHLWQDREHPRGLWRRTVASELAKPEPAWEVVLDIDALAAAEQQNWVFKEVEFLRPACRLVLVQLSPGGGDAAEIREFDVTTRAFVPGGFQLPAAKTSVSWVDENELYVGADVGPDSLTSSGYPRTIRRWRRGTPLADSPVVFQGQTDDVAVYGRRHRTAGYVRDLVSRLVDFHHRQTFLLTAEGDLVKIDVPDDAVIDMHREWLLVDVRTPWNVGGSRFPAGSLLAAQFDAFLAGERRLTVLFEPDHDRVLDYHRSTRHHLIVASLHHVRSRLELLTPGADGWQRHAIAEPQPTTGTGFAELAIEDTQPDTGDEYLLRTGGFIEPPALLLGRAGGGPAALLRQEPASFDATGLTVSQHFAVSPDGTQVPYFVVGDPTRPGPALLTGYGGFQVSLTPGYDRVIGRGWLARGGRFVVANIRGGGEYGPDWHLAAIRENRRLAYQDFAAVAADLLERGLTTVDQLGIVGRSNGGLLTGVMLTSYPHLFGAVACVAPILDMRRYHRLLAGASWMAEYGDPDQDADWAFLSRYSPYHHLSAGRRYPPVLILTSTRDDRVHPGHARKMAARLSELGHDVTYYENIDGGHAGAADNAGLAFHWALILDFLWQHLSRPGTGQLTAPPAGPAR